eukprot:2682199-Prymnesium_polylepis.2
MHDPRVLPLGRHARLLHRTPQNAPLRPAGALAQPIGPPHRPLSGRTLSRPTCEGTSPERPQPHVGRRGRTPQAH